jgi:uncharacterized lipoprotein YajG
MKRISGLLSALAAFVFLASCAAVPAQTVTLAPDIKAPTGNVGKGKSLAFKVIDGRADKVVGYRNADGSRTAPITVQGDLSAPVGEAAARVLSELGFVPAPFKDGAPLSLTITVRELGYNAAAATVTRKVSVRCVLSARVVNGAGNWEGTFPVGQEKEMVTVPGEADNARFLNDALSESLSMLLSDPELVQYLGHDPFQAKIVK